MIYIENIIFQAELFYFDKPTVAIMGFYCEKVHPLAKSTTYNTRDIARIPIGHTS
jgi:hypothetical protein